MSTDGSWLDGWNGQSLEALASRMRALGADDAESWAESELSENIAQTARFLFLRGAWRRMSEHLESTVAAVDRVHRSSSDIEDVRAVLAGSLYELTFDLLYLLDEPDGAFHSTDPSTDVGEDEPRWALMELSPGGAATGRRVGGLHESLIETAPGGEAAASDAGWI